MKECATCLWQTVKLIRSRRSVVRLVHRFNTQHHQFKHLSIRRNLKPLINVMYLMKLEFITLLFNKFTESFYRFCNTLFWNICFNRYAAWEYSSITMIDFRSRNRTFSAYSYYLARNNIHLREGGMKFCVTYCGIHWMRQALDSIDSKEFEETFSQHKLTEA